MTRRLDRRTMLRGTGGALLALPYLDAMAAPTVVSKVPMRMACIGLNFGLVPQLFFPEQTGKDYVLTDRLQPLNEFRDDFTVFSGLDHGVNAQGGHGGVHAYLSGVLSKNSSGMPEANISIDQKAAQFVGAKTRYPSLELASGKGDVNNMLSWSASGVAIPRVGDVQVIYDLLFQRVDPKLRDRTHKELTVRSSILDLVKTDEEPNGKPLLDNSMVLFGSGMGNASSHSNKNLPLLLAGGGFRHGEHKSYFKDSAKKVATPAANLFVSMLQRFGMEIDQFGLSGGKLSGLEVQS